MTRHHVGLESKLLQDAEHAQLRHTQRRLRDVRDRDLGHRLRLVLLREAGRRVDVFAKPLRESLLERVVGLLDARAELGKHQRKIAHHVGSLRTLTREEERHLAPGANRLGLEIDAARILDGLCAVREGLLRGLDLGQQVILRIGRDGERANTLGSSLPARLREVAQGGGRCLDGRGLCGELCGDVLRIRAAPDEKFRRPGLPNLLRRGRLCLFQHGVEIRAAETERIHTSAAGLAVGDPGARFGVHVNGTLRIAERSRAGLLHVDRWRDHFVMQRQRGLDQTGDARAALGVSDIRLHGTDRARLRSSAGFAHADRHAFRLGAVAEYRAGAVRFNESDRTQRETRHGIGLIQRARLAFLARSREALALAVAGTSDATDHRINPVAIPLREIASLQDDRTHAFADADAVGVRIKRLRAARLRKRARLGEAEKTVRVLERIGRADDGHRRIARDDLLHAEVRRGETGCAGGIDSEIGSAEVEAIRDATGHNIRENAGERILGPFRQLLQHVFGDILKVHRKRRTETVGETEITHAARHAENAGRVTFVERLVHVARVTHRARRHLEGEELDGVDRLQRVRRDAILSGVEDHRINEAAPTGVNLVTGLRIFVEVEPPIPALEWHFGNAVGLVEDVFPEGLQIRRLREHATHADNGDILAQGLSGTFHLSLALNASTILVYRHDRKSTEAPNRPACSPTLLHTTCTARCLTQGSNAGCSKNHASKKFGR